MIGRCINDVHDLDERKEALWILVIITLWARRLKTAEGLVVES